MDIELIGLFVESLMGFCAFADGGGELLAATPRFKKVFYFKKLAEASFRELLEIEDGARDRYMEIISEMRGGLKDFADMTIRWRGQCYQLQFIALCSGGVFKGSLLNLTDISDRARDAERSRKEINDLMLFQQVAFGREKKMDELRQKIKELTRQLSELGVS